MKSSNPILTNLAALSVLLLPTAWASPTHSPGTPLPPSVQARDDPNTLVWIPTDLPQQLCHNITIDLTVSPNKSSEAPDCTAVRNMYAPPPGTATAIIKNTASYATGYWNVSLDQNPTIISPNGTMSAYPFSILAGDANCTVYVETAVNYDQVPVFQFGNVDLVSIVDQVIKDKKVHFGSATCSDPTSNQTNIGRYYVGPGRLTPNHSFLRGHSS